MAMTDCRGCGRPLHDDDVVCDLGALPLANSLLSAEDLGKPETHYPLRPVVCRSCLLVQLPNVLQANEIFTESYPFFSGQSRVWRDHCNEFARMIIQRLELSTKSRILEIGSNDGTMLAPFMVRGMQALGIEPCRDVAEHALRKGLATYITFWSDSHAKNMVGSGYNADLVIATNVLAHVPDLQDFLMGVTRVLAENGTAVFEVPYVGNMIEEGQFDQIYTEHHCYFSACSLNVALKRAGLQIVSIERIPTHGGSIRVYAQLATKKHPQPQLAGWMLKEVATGLTSMDAYKGFALKPPLFKRQALKRLSNYIGVGIVGYGASAKATVVLNYCGIGPELIEAVADTTPAKQGHYIPGVRIPIISHDELANLNPDVVVNFCWNWPKESEENIRKVCPKASIMYLHRSPRALTAVRSG